MMLMLLKLFIPQPQTKDVLDVWLNHIGNAQEEQHQALILVQSFVEMDTFSQALSNVMIPMQHQVMDALIFVT